MLTQLFVVALHHHQMQMAAGLCAGQLHSDQHRIQN
jgi:hypothetical protein